MPMSLRCNLVLHENVFNVTVPLHTRKNSQLLRLDLPAPLRASQLGVESARAEPDPIASPFAAERRRWCRCARACPCPCPCGCSCAQHKVQAASLSAGGKWAPRDPAPLPVAHALRRAAPLARYNGTNPPRVVGFRAI